jgi:hypothetical protein
MAKVDVVKREEVALDAYNTWLEGLAGEVTRLNQSTLLGIYEIGKYVNDMLTDGNNTYGSHTVEQVSKDLEERYGHNNLKPNVLYDAQRVYVKLSRSQLKILADKGTPAGVAIELCQTSIPPEFIDEVVKRVAATGRRPLRTEIRDALAAFKATDGERASAVEVPPRFDAEEPEPPETPKAPPAPTASVREKARKAISGEEGQTVGKVLRELEGFAKRVTSMAGSLAAGEYNLAECTDLIMEDGNDDQKNRCVQALSDAADAVESLSQNTVAQVEEAMRLTKKSRK